MRSLGNISFSSSVENLVIRNCHRQTWNPAPIQLVVIINLNIFPITESTTEEGAIGLVILSRTMLKRNQCCATWEPENKFLARFLKSFPWRQTKPSCVTRTHQPTPNLILQMEICRFCCKSVQWSQFQESSQILWLSLCGNNQQRSNEIPRNHN